jgi:hypothetical protein
MYNTLTIFQAFGVKSFVEDIWALQEVISLLEGGNSRFREFCAITNAYPALDEAIDDHVQFINLLYASNPVKAYRSLLRKSVQKVIQERQGLIARNGQWLDPGEDRLGPGDESKAKETNMLSIHDFYTIVLNKEWPTDQVAEAPRAADQVAEESKYVSFGSVWDTTVPDKESDGSSVLDEILGDALPAPAQEAGEESEESEESPSDEATSIENATGSNQPESESSKENGGSAKEMEEYVLPLKSGDNHEIPLHGDDAAHLQSVPAAEKRAGADAYDLPFMKEIQPARTARISGGDDDEKSVISMGSSVGDLDLRSLPDGKSVCSADLESLPEVNEEDQMVKNLEPLPTKESFRNLAENAPEEIYGPQNALETARNIHELESPSSNVKDDDDASSVGSGIIEHESPLHKTSSLERSIQLLDATIGAMDADHKTSVSPPRERGKTIGFEGLPSNPPQRTESKPKKIPRMRQQQQQQVNRVRPIETNDNLLLEDFRPRHALNDSDNSVSRAPTVPSGALSGPEAPGREEWPHAPFFELRRPIAINGRMGPPVTKKSDYTPRMRSPPTAVSETSAKTESMSTTTGSEESYEDRAPTGQKMLSAYRHHMRSLARNLGRQTPRGKESSADAELQDQIPQLTGNLAPRGQEEWNLHVTAMQEEEINSASNSTRPTFGSLIRNRLQHQDGTTGEAIVSRLSDSLRATFSTREED